MNPAPQSTPEDHIAYDRETGAARCYNGPKAVDVFRVRILASSIQLHGKTGMKPTRGVTITKMMKMATEYTGKKYKRTDHDVACADLLALAAVRMADLSAVEV